MVVLKWIHGKRLLYEHKHFIGRASYVLPFQLGKSLDKKSLLQKIQLFYSFKIDYLAVEEAKRFSVGIDILFRRGLMNMTATGSHRSCLPRKNGEKFSKRI